MSHKQVILITQLNYHTNKLLKKCKKKDKDTALPIWRNSKN